MRAGDTGPLNRLLAALRRRNLADMGFSVITGGAAFVIVAVFIGVMIVLLKESWPSIQRFGFINFIFSTAWNPVKESFGAAPALFGTAVTTIISLIIAVPVSIGIAIFLSELAPDFLKAPVGVAIELLAAIPSIVYGMWGLFTLAPLMARHVEPVLQRLFGHIPLVGRLFEGTPLGFDLLTASVILSIMIIPFTASIARDAFNLTPPIIKESAYGIGAMKWEVVRDIVIPNSRIAVFGGIVLSLGRALGETMAVSFVLGNNHKISGSLLDAASTITVTLANEFTEADSDIYLSSLFHLALLLFLMSFIVLALAKFFLLRSHRSHVR